MLLGNAAHSSSSRFPVGKGRLKILRSLAKKDLVFSERSYRKERKKGAIEKSFRVGLTSFLRDI